MEAGNRGHSLVFISSLLYLCGLIYGALGGAYFNIVPVNISENTKVLANSAFDPNVLFHNNNAIAAVGVRYSCLIGTLSLDLIVGRSSMPISQVLPFSSSRTICISYPDHVRVVRFRIPPFHVS